MKLTLTRFCYAPDATFGRLVVGDLTVFSVERPWRDNQPYESCIPEGDYRCIWEPTTTPVPEEFGDHTWYVVGGTVGLHTGDRTRIAWHVGNTPADVEGCQAFGTRLGTVHGRWAVARSVDAMRALHAALPREFGLRIEWGMAV